jgi:selenide,water dikinase
MGPGDLAKLLDGLPPSRHPDLLLPAEHGADAGIIRVAPDLAVVQSADFFPPLIADARAFGRIAAANALSDIYAVGAKPVGAVNLLATPRSEAFDGLRAMLAGAQEVVEAAGAAMLGGHTLIDTSVKFGLAVTGVVHPARIIRHDTPQTGDVLVLTKPLGTAVVLTACDRDLAGAEELGACIALMSETNRLAGERLYEYGAHAATDITGFGLLAHALDMLSTAPLGMTLAWQATPMLDHVAELIKAGAVCGGTKRNMDFTASRVDYGEAPEWVRVLLNDAQTSGGLLVALPEGAAERFIAALREAGYRLPLAIIGRVVDQLAGTISVQ